MNDGKIAIIDAIHHSNYNIFIKPHKSKGLFFNMPSCESHIKHIWIKMVRKVSNSIFIETIIIAVWINSTKNLARWKLILLRHWIPVVVMDPGRPGAAPVPATSQISKVIDIQETLYWVCTIVIGLWLGAGRPSLATHWSECGLSTPNTTKTHLGTETCRPPQVPWDSGGQGQVGCPS